MDRTKPNVYFAADSDASGSDPLANYIENVDLSKFSAEEADALKAQLADVSNQMQKEYFKKGILEKGKREIEASLNKQFELMNATAKSVPAVPEKEEFEKGSSSAKEGVTEVPSSLATTNVTEAPFDYKTEFVKGAVKMGCPAPGTSSFNRPREIAGKKVTDAAAIASCYLLGETIKAKDPYKEDLKKQYEIVEFYKGLSSKELTSTYDPSQTGGTYGAWNEYGSSLVPVTYLDTIIEAERETYDLTPFTRSFPVSTKKGQLHYKLPDPNIEASWGDEAYPYAPSSIGWADDEWSTHKLMAMTYYTREFLRWASIDVGSIIATEHAYQHGLSKYNIVINGKYGGLTPWGIDPASAVASENAYQFSADVATAVGMPHAEPNLLNFPRFTTTGSGAASATNPHAVWTPEFIMRIFYAIPPYLRKNLQVMMTRETECAMRVMADANMRYYFDWPNGPNTVPNFMGMPIIHHEAIASGTTGEIEWTPPGGTKVKQTFSYSHIYIGNFKAGYWLFDFEQMTMETTKDATLTFKVGGNDRTINLWQKDMFAVKSYQYLDGRWMFNNFLVDPSTGKPSEVAGVAQRYPFYLWKIPYVTTAILTSKAV